MSMPKKVLIALSPSQLEIVDYMASQEHRTRSDLIREALRRYENQFKRDQALPIQLVQPAAAGIS